MIFQIGAEEIRTPAAAFFWKEKSDLNQKPPER